METPTFSTSFSILESGYKGTDFKILIKCFALYPLFTYSLFSPSTTVSVSVYLCIIILSINCFIIKPSYRYTDTPFLYFVNNLESLKQLDSLKTKIQIRKNEHAHTSVSSERVTVFDQSWVESIQNDEGLKDKAFDEGYVDNQGLCDVQIYQKSRNQLAENAFMHSIEMATTVSPDYFGNFSTLLLVLRDDNTILFNFKRRY